MADVTLKAIDEMETLFDGIARRARAELGVTAWGMQVMTLPPSGTGIRITPTAPARRRRPGGGLHPAGRARRRLVADEEAFELRPGVMVRVAPEQRRRILPGPEGIRFVALGGVVGPIRRRRGPSSAALAGAGCPREPGARSAARRRSARRRAGVRRADRATPPLVARPRVPDARLAARRRRRAAGDTAAGLARAARLRAAGGAVDLAAPHRHQRRPAHDRAAEP